MNLLAQLGRQVTELFTSLTPASRIMAALLLAVTVISFGWLVAVGQGDAKVYILGLLTPEEIHRAEQAFGAAMLGDYEVVNGTRIKVPAAKKALYLKALADGGAIPAQWGDEIKASLQTGIFDPPSLISRREEVAREKEFAKLLERMPQIHFAAVEYDEEDGGFAREPIKVCSIQVQGYANQPIDRTVLKSIAEQASTYFAGIRKENISVLDLGTSVSYRPSADPATEENPVLLAQAEWEEYFKRQVHDVLNQYGAIKVAVNVELDPKLEEITESLKFDPTGVAIQSSTSRKDVESAKPISGGRPGVNPNALNSPQTIADAGVQTSKTKEAEEMTESRYGTNAIRTKMAGLVPKSVKVSVGIPESYYRKVFVYQWLLQNPDKSEQDAPAPDATQLANLKASVEQAVTAAVEGIPVGVRQGDDRKPFIRVYSYTDLPVPEVPPPSFAEITMAWLTANWSTLALIGVVLVALGMMFSWVKAGAKGPAAADRDFEEGFGLTLPIPVEDELDLSDAPQAEESEGERKKRMPQVTGADIKEDLSSLIRENPDIAVNMLKTWIGEAA
ncbi:MAG: beta-cystathionase [Pirellulaceae bacterium]|nr:MAG: beta-cystathionase [Pirellulaceae bacterium]